MTAMSDILRLQFAALLAEGRQGPDFGSVTPSKTPASPAAATKPQPASITVQAPEAAEVWLCIYRSRQGRANRHFETPPVDPGKMYFYDLQVRWSGGRWSGRLTFRGGKHKEVFGPSKTTANLSGSGGNAPVSSPSGVVP